MKIEIWNERREPEKVLRLRLKPYAGGAAVVAVDENGVELDGGFLLAISEYGITRCKAVSEDLDLPLNSEGCVCIVGEP